MRSTSDDSVDGVVLSGTAYILVLGFPVIIHEEMLINNGVNVGVLWGFDGWSGKVRLMSLSINGEGAKELLGLVKGVTLDSGRGKRRLKDNGGTRESLKGVFKGY